MNNQAIKAPAVFTPAAVAAINEGYAEACRIAKATDPDDRLRFRLADRVMFLARNGELDPRRLSTEAVAAVMSETEAQQSNAKTPPAATPGATGTGEFVKVP
jgi:hypothetical protein